MSEQTAKSALSRREFHAALALLAVAPLAAVAADEKPAVEPLTAVGDALAAVAKARFGKHLTADQLAEVEKSVRAGVFRAELMKNIPLTNGDEPAFAFTADLP